LQMHPNQLDVEMLSTTLLGISPSVAVKLQVICGDFDHIMLLLLAVVGVLAYPLAIFAALVRITWKYPTWLLI